MQQHAADSRYAWTRLAITLALMTIGSAAMYIVAVVLPTVQADFGVSRADASLPYTMMMVGFGIGGMLMGRLADRFGVMVPILVGATGLGLGFAAADKGDPFAVRRPHRAIFFVLVFRQGVHFFRLDVV